MKLRPVRAQVDGYRLVPESSAQDSLELHVLARAYRAAWIAQHAQEPTGMHRIERLGIAFYYDAPERAEPGHAG